MRPDRSLVLGVMFVWLAVATLLVGQMTASENPRSSTLVLHTRKFVPSTAPGQPSAFVRKDNVVEWPSQKTALIVCDMWDHHWCRGAEARVAEMAVPMNRIIHAARDRGVLIIHAPSTTVDFYQGTAQRTRAQAAKFSKTIRPLATMERWGTAWCYPDPSREPEIPIDDTDMGCDCETKCKIEPPWTRQISTLDIADQDVITDNGQETFNLLAERGIENVIMMGVHLNMCVLGRPFAIRQLVQQGKHVVLVRDLTDTMYNSKMKPFVDHFTGTDLMIGHVEKYWCPTILSTDIAGGTPFKFREDQRVALSP